MVAQLWGDSEIFILGASSCEEDAATQVMKVHKYL